MDWLTGISLVSAGVLVVWCWRIAVWSERREVEARQHFSRIMDACSESKPRAAGLTTDRTKVG